VVSRMLSGMIIIGVEDAKHTIVGVPDDRVAMTIDTILRAARQNVKPALVLDPPESELYELGGKRLVARALVQSLSTSGRCSPGFSVECEAEARSRHAIKYWRLGTKTCWRREWSANQLDSRWINWGTIS